MSTKRVKAIADYDDDGYDDDYDEGYGEEEDAEKGEKTYLLPRIYAHLSYRFER